MASLGELFGHIKALSNADSDNCSYRKQLLLTPVVRAFLVQDWFTVGGKSTAGNW